MSNIKQIRAKRRKKRVSNRFFGTSECPRISVYRSNKHIFVQAVDDVNALTIASVHSKQVGKTEGKTKVDVAREVGQTLAAKLKEKKVSNAVFDRGPYAYNGRVKNIAEGLRENDITI